MPTSVACEHRTHATSRTARRYRWRGRRSRPYSRRHSAPRRSSRRSAEARLVAPPARRATRGSSRPRAGEDRQRRGWTGDICRWGRWGAWARVTAPERGGFVLLDATSELAHAHRLARAHLRMLAASPGASLSWRRSSDGKAGCVIQSLRDSRMQELTSPAPSADPAAPRPHIVGRTMLFLTPTVSELAALLVARPRRMPSSSAENYLGSADVRTNVQED